MHSSHTLYPKNGTSSSSSINRRFFFFFFLHNKIFFSFASSPRLVRMNFRFTRIMYNCSRICPFCFSLFLSFSLSLRPAFYRLILLKKKKKNLLHSKTGTLNTIFYNIHYFLLYCARESNLKRYCFCVFFSFYVQLYRYTLYNSILIYPKNLTANCIIVRDGVFIKEWRKEWKTIIVIVFLGSHRHLW